MTTANPIDITKLISSLAPREYDGGSAQDGLAFLSTTTVYFGTLVNGGIPSNVAWLMILNRLTGNAAKWANPHIVTAAMTAPWADAAVFSLAFKEHFCAVDDKDAAIAELVKLCKKSHKVGDVQEYTAQFNAAAARTCFSDEDKHERYRQGLPYRIKNEFATTAHDISDVSKMQKVALKMDQHLAQQSEERPRTFQFRGRGGKVAATGTRPPFGGECHTCGKKGHKAFECPDRHRNRQQVASSSTSSPSPSPRPHPPHPTSSLPFKRK